MRRTLLFAWTPFLTVATAAAAPPAQRYAEDTSAPGFADPQRRAKLAATFLAIDALVELDCERGADAILILGLDAGTPKLGSVRIVAAQDGPCRVE